jgi:uncharacterized protein (DUF4415 family)
MKKNGRSASAIPAAAPRRKRTRARSAKRRRKAVSPLSAEAKRQSLALQTMRIGDFYRPLKKPITLRVDADVLAWFKKDGKRYQSRMNAALRKVMEREMKAS